MHQYVFFHPVLDQQWFIGLIKKVQKFCKKNQKTLSVLNSFLELHPYPPGNNDILFSNSVMKHLFSGFFSPRPMKKQFVTWHFSYDTHKLQLGHPCKSHFPCAEAIYFSQGLGLETGLPSIHFGMLQKVLDDACCSVPNIDDYRILLYFHSNYY